MFGMVIFYVYIVIVVGLVLFVGLMLGFILGLMLFDLVDFEVFQKFGMLVDQKYVGMKFYKI